MIVLCMLGLPEVLAQQACLSKLSPMLRRYVLENRELSRGMASTRTSVVPSPWGTAFVRLTSEFCGNSREKGRNFLQEEGCRVWANWGDIYAVSFPMDRLAALSLRPEVTRLEANANTKCTMDSAVVQVNALKVYEGWQLPQAFTGKCVVMGIMDIGFDLTHPNFYNYQMTDYRIKALWDMISSDTLHSELPVGRDFVGKNALLAQGCSTDGHDQTHGTHTLGIAAGSGGEGVPMSVPGKYHGMAYESDICLVANATTENQSLIDPSQLYKFTYVMDALGFKYIFDYADRVGKPCVISFSEGASQDFEGYDILYNEVLDSLTSVPGHIIVSSAGNNGLLPYYIHKAMGKESAGCFVNNSKSYAYLTAKSAQPFTIRTSIYEGRKNPTLFDISTEKVLEAPDFTYIDTLDVAGKRYVLTVGAYPSCYDSRETCYDWMIKTDDEAMIGTENYMTYQVMGVDADVQVYHGSGNMYPSSVNPSLCDAEFSHSINSPACAESVICVGSTVNRTCIIDWKGNQKTMETHPIGSRVSTSSIGPTFDERIKPDVVAPGSNVLSSYSSYYEQYHPNANDVLYSDVAHFDYQGRTYAWNSNAGTSMASPVVGGAIALWLEANPKLTRRDVMEIIRKTSKPLDAAHSVPNNYWGYGLIDVYQGLLAALQVDGIKNVSQHQPLHVQVDVKEGCIVLALDSESTIPFRVSVYNTAGIRVSTTRYGVGVKECQIDASSLQSGVYVIQVLGDEEITGSSLVRVK